MQANNNKKKLFLGKLIFGAALQHVCNMQLATVLKIKTDINTFENVRLLIKITMLHKKKR